MEPTTRPKDRSKIYLARKCYFSCGVKRQNFEAGFNYIFEAFFHGPIDPVSGLVVNLTDIKAVLKEVELLVNQKHLNHDVPNLKKYDLASIHKFLHDYFKSLFSNADFPDEIILVATKLTEGEGVRSEIYEPLPLGNQAFRLE